MMGSVVRSNGLCDANADDNEVEVAVMEEATSFVADVTSWETTVLNASIVEVVRTPCEVTTFEAVIVEVEETFGSPVRSPPDSLMCKFES